MVIGCLNMQTASHLLHALVRSLRSPEPGWEGLFAPHRPSPTVGSGNQSCAGCICRAWLSHIQATNQAHRCSRFGGYFHITWHAIWFTWGTFPLAPLELYLSVLSWYVTNNIFFRLSCWIRIFLKQFTIMLWKLLLNLLLKKVLMKHMKAVLSARFCSQNFPVSIMFASYFWCSFMFSVILKRKEILIIWSQFVCVVLKN